MLNLFQKLFPCIFQKSILNNSNYEREILFSHNNNNENITKPDDAEEPFEIHEKILSDFQQGNLLENNLFNQSSSINNHVEQSPLSSLPFAITVQDLEAEQFKIIDASQVSSVKKHKNKCLNHNSKHFTPEVSQQVYSRKRPHNKRSIMSKFMRDVFTQTFEPRLQFRNMATQVDFLDIDETIVESSPKDNEDNLMEKYYQWTRIDDYLDIIPRKISDSLW